MDLKRTFLFWTILGASLADVINNKKFPDYPKFSFGVATSAFQIEGAWEEDGKGENMWDHITHTRPETVRDQSTADIACDSYHKYKEDIAMLKYLGVDHYRFSISWSRILPTGFVDEINEAGVNYYKNIIKELKINDIEPLMTIYHWDLPEPLHELGGWLNETIVGYFADYARTCFQEFGDDVKLWATFNEPKQSCEGGYGSAWMAPLINNSGISDYICAHNLIKSHAAAYHIYDEEFRPTQNGKISIVIDTYWYEAESDSTEDQEAAQTEREFDFGWFANPIYVGDYPEIMKKRIADRSKAEGYTESRLPAFTDEEIAYVNGTHDYFGLNFYTAYLVRRLSEPEIGVPNYYSDIGVEIYQPDDWEPSNYFVVKVTPWSMRKILNYISNMYNNPGIMITENGYPGNGSTLNDTFRINYYQGYISGVRDAMDDGVNIIGYTAWSLMDNYEWFEGYTQKYGIYHVDFDSPNRTRTPKASADWIKKLYATRCLVDSCE